MVYSDFLKGVEPLVFVRLDRFGCLLLAAGLQGVAAVGRPHRWPKRSILHNQNLASPKSATTIAGLFCRANQSTWLISFNLSAIIQADAWLSFIPHNSATSCKTIYNCCIDMLQKPLKKKQDPPITQFKGYFEFLSIDNKSPVCFQAITYPSVAVAFHAARTNDPTLRKRISQIQDQDQFKSAISEIKSAADWPTRRLSVMTLLNRDKFKRNKELGLKLIATQSRHIINGFERGGEAEHFWGMVQRNGHFEGQNSLGKILMSLREEMKSGLDSKNWVNELNLERDADLWPDTHIVIEKQGEEVGKLCLALKNSFFLGSSEQNDFRMQHGSISKFHGCIYFSSDMQVVLVDLNSSHGTVLQSGGQTSTVECLKPTCLKSGDVVKFGRSTRSYTVYFSYEQVRSRMDGSQRKARQELQRIDQLRKVEQGQPNEAMQRNAIKSLLELQDYACLHLENVDRNFSYKDIKQTFSKYGQVKNVRINIDQKTGRFMGDLLVYYDQKVKITKVVESIAREPIQFRFKLTALSSDEATRIIASFTAKGKDDQKPQKAGKQRSKEGTRRSRSRSRERRKRREKSSSSGSGRNRKRKQYEES